MPTPQRRGLARLVSDHGHTMRYAEPGVLIYPDGRTVMALECAFCGVALVHYVARDARGVACWSNAPYTFPSLAEAEAARDELAAQNEGE